MEAGAGSWRSEDESAVAGTQPRAVRVFPIAAVLARAFAVGDPAERLRLCREASELDPECEVAQLALASACRETRDGAAARDALDRATALAPEWEAVFYESGKLSLIYDDLPRARDAFQRAADLMPSFAAAFSNLGATLGELGDPVAALKAFRGRSPPIRTASPSSTTSAWSAVSWDASTNRRRHSGASIERNPAFVFGHYNLGHTLFLAGRYGEALHAYDRGTASRSAAEPASGLPPGDGAPRGRR